MMTFNAGHVKTQMVKAKVGIFRFRKTQVDKINSHPESIQG
jgi:hypothetical protein